MEDKNSKPLWKEIFSFASGGKLKSLELMYDLALGVVILFVNFFVGNACTMLFESWFSGLSLAWKNVLDVAIPSLLCAALFCGLFLLLKNKRIVPAAYYIDLILIVIVLIIFLFKLSKDTLAVLLPVFLCIVVIPALIGTAAVTVLYFRTRKAAGA